MRTEIFLRMGAEVCVTDIFMLATGYVYCYTGLPSSHISLYLFPPPEVVPVAIYAFYQKANPHVKHWLDIGGEKYL